jgi:M6 family metalloprotease-like protein
MKFKKTSIALFSTLIFLHVTPVHSAVKTGSSCTTVGAISITGGVKYICIKSGKKLSWSKVKIIPDPIISKAVDYADVRLCQLESKLETQSLGVNRDPLSLNSTGNLNVGVIFVSFQDAPGDSKVFKFWKDVQQKNADKYFESASYGRLKVGFTSVEKFYQIQKPSTFYHLNFDPHTNQRDPLAYVQGVFEDAVALAKDDYDFSKIDVLHIVFPDSALIGSNGATGLRLKIGNKTVYQGLIAPMDKSKTNKVEPGDTGILHDKWLVHELGHNLGLLHPYDTYNLSEKSKRDFSVVAWSVMGYDDAIGTDLLAWEKFILGWIDPVQVNCIQVDSKNSTTMFLEAISLKSAAKKLAVIPLSATQAIVVESRRKSSIDFLKSNEEGVLVYTVDVNKKSNEGAVEVVFKNSKSRRTPSTPSMLVGTLSQGESVSLMGFKITASKYKITGDFVTIKKS